MRDHEAPERCYFEGLHARATADRDAGLAWVAALAVLATAAPATSQPRSLIDPTGLPTLVSVEVERAPVLDGVVMGDPAWSEANPTAAFWQTRPDEGEPSSEKTEVRFVFSDTTLYIGVVCYD